MSSRKYAGAACLALSVVLFSLSGALADVSSELQDALRTGTMAGGETLLEPATLDAFYRERDYRLAWRDGQGVELNAQRLLSVLNATDHPVPPGAVRHLDSIYRQLNAPAPHERALLDLLLSDAFLHYVRIVGQPLLGPAALQEQGYPPAPPVDAAQMLERALQSGGFSTALAALEPQHAAWRRLRERLADYLEIQARGGWPPFSRHGARLEPGMDSAEIATLRELLTVTGDLPEAAAESTLYDAGLQQAVQRFQRRHGLAIDGVVGNATRAALAVPVQQRIAQLRINLERWRWLPRDLGARYIIVNSAAFELQAYADGSAPLTMRVIVGQKDRETPVLAENMRYLVVNPYWHVPDTIARRDLIPELLQDPEYFARKGIRVLTGRGVGATEVDAAGIAWQDYLGDGDLPYRLRQDPGPGNSLGRIKFMFPNPYSVYLHDTPARALFDRPVRAFSSGCIRVEQPLALANYVLAGDARAQQTLDALLASGITASLPLPAPVPVYLLYHTAWVDADGALNFRDDIYRRDRRLLAALPALGAPQQVLGNAEKPPQSETVSLLH